MAVTALQPSKARSTRGGVGPYVNAGAPSNGTNEIQTLTFGSGITGGTFKLRFQNQVTAAISWSATNNTLRDNVDAALEALSGIGTGGVTTAVGTMTAGIGTLTVTFDGALVQKLDVPLMTVEANNLTGTTHTLTIATTTAGVNATGRGAAKSAELVDTTNGDPYVNAGTTTAPYWVRQAAVRVDKIALAAVDSAGGIFSWQNPEAGAIVVTRVDIRVTTIATGACLIDVGTTAATATTLSDNLIDGLDVHSAAGTFSTLSQAGANGVPPKELAAGKWVTGSLESGASAGIVGSAYVHYYKV